MKATAKKPVGRRYPISPLLAMSQLTSPKELSREGHLRAEAEVFDAVYKALARKHGDDGDALKEALAAIEKNGGIGPEGDRLIDGVRVLLERYGERESFLIAALEPMAAEFWENPTTLARNKMAFAAAVFPYQKIKKLILKWQYNISDDWTGWFLDWIGGSSVHDESSFEWPMGVFHFVSNIDLPEQEMAADIGKALGRSLSLTELYSKAPSPVDQRA
jgi:hypothetical protein